MSNNTFCSQSNTSYTFSIYILMYSKTNNSSCTLLHNSTPYLIRLNGSTQLSYDFILLIDGDT